MDTHQKEGKMSLRRENRIFAVQWSYMCEIRGINPSDQSFNDLCSLFDKNPSDFKFAYEIVMLLKQHVADIDALIGRLTTNWSIVRVSAVDLCILREAACELLYRAFINGVLDRIKNTLSRSLRSAK